MATYDQKQRLHWTHTNPGRAGWYWMLNPYEQPGLPTIVRIERDWETGRLIALIPPSRYPTQASAIMAVNRLDALWAGPLDIPSIARSSPRRVLRFQTDGPADIAA